MASYVGNWLGRDDANSSKIYSKASVYFILSLKLVLMAGITIFRVFISELVTNDAEIQEYI